MDQRYASTSGNRSSLVTTASFPDIKVGAESILGVVKESEVSFSKEYTIAVIETEKNDRYVLLVKYNAGFLTGKLVVFNPQNKSVAMFDHEKYVYSVVAIVEAPLGQNQQTENVICPDCNVMLTPKNLKKHLKDEHLFESL